VLHDRLAKAMNKYGRRDVLAEVKNIISDTIHGLIIDTDFDQEYPYTNFVYYLAYTNGVHTQIVEHAETGILRIEANPYLDDRFLTQFQNRRDPYFKFHKTDIAAHMRYLEKIPRKQRFIPEGFRTFEEYDEHNAAIAFGEMFSKIDKMDKIWSKYQTPLLTVECATCASNIIESDIITDAEKQILVINHPEYKDRYPICRNCYRSIFLPQSECRGACKRIRAHHDALINDPERLRSSFIIGMARGVIGLRKYLVDFIPKNEIDAMTDDEIVEFAENM
jgi:hypothetical protein